MINGMINAHSILHRVRRWLLAGPGAGDAFLSTCLRVDREHADHPSLDGAASQRQGNGRPVAAFICGWVSPSP
jgi:hypothetical protein